MNNFVPAQSEFLCQKEREARSKSKKGRTRKNRKIQNFAHGLTIFTLNTISARKWYFIIIQEKLHIKPELVKQERQRKGHDYTF